MSLLRSSALRLGCSGRCCSAHGMHSGWSSSPKKGCHQQISCPARQRLRPPKHSVSRVQLRRHLANHWIRRTDGPPWCRRQRPRPKSKNDPGSPTPLRIPNAGDLGPKLLRTVPSPEISVRSWHPSYWPRSPQPWSCSASASAPSYATNASSATARWLPLLGLPGTPTARPRICSHRPYVPPVDWVRQRPAWRLNPLGLIVEVESSTDLQPRACTGPHRKPLPANRLVRSPGWKPRQESSWSNGQLCVREPCSRSAARVGAIRSAKAGAAPCFSGSSQISARRSTE